MERLRLIIRCVTHPDSHAKKLEMKGLSREFVEEFAGLLCGTSPRYVYKPGPDSPIGKCATCGGSLTWEFEEMEQPDAEPQK